MLPEERRKQLDDIVVKMSEQNAPEEDVKLIVDDFKKKFDIQEEKKTGFIQGIAQSIAKPFLQEYATLAAIPKAYEAQKAGLPGIELEKTVKDFGYFGKAGAFETPSKATLGGIEAGLTLSPFPFGKAAAPVVKGAVSKVAKPIIEDIAEKRAISALEPVMTKAEKLRAVQEGLGKKTLPTGKVTIETPKNIQDLALRLKGTLKSSDPLKNMRSLNNEMVVTETNLNRLLRTDKTPVIKQAVGDSLEELKGKIPLGFKSEASMQNAYNTAVEFAKSLVNKNEPTINGLRKARIEFDRMAKKQFPNAFKGGSVDTKTPAGSAIKAARSHINDYLYNTAKDGSEIQALIKKEADIFEAKSILAPKIIKQYGTTRVERALESLPIVGGIAKQAARIIKR